MLKVTEPGKRFFKTRLALLCLTLTIYGTAYGSPPDEKSINSSYLIPNYPAPEFAEEQPESPQASYFELAQNKMHSGSPSISRDTPLEKTDPEEKRWSSFLPFKAEEAISRGYELPLPLGVSANMVYLKRVVEVKDINAAINGPPRDLNNFISIDTNNRVSSAALRLDSWILPFLNLYVLGGYIENNTKLSATVTLPPLLPGGTPNVIPINTQADLDGSVFGAGITLAGGYDDFFLSLDANYSDADLDGTIEQKIDVFMYSFRSGWRGPIGRYMTNIWLGGMYWDSEREIKGSIPLDNANIINYRVLQGPSEPSNFLTGFNVEFSKSFHMMFEYGYNFDDLQMFVTSIAYRF